jgi:ribose transport system permease protein
MSEALPGPPVARRRDSLLATVVLATTAVLIVVFAMLIEGFATLGNLRVILSNSAALVILGCGMGVVVISRGLDLSLIAVMVAGATTFSTLINAGAPGLGALAGALAAMLMIGAVNAWLIAFVEIPALLATLASAMAITGLFRFFILRGEYLLLLPKTNPAVEMLSGSLVPGLTAPVGLMLLVLGGCWFLLNRTSAGRTIFAIGDNFQAARMTGLPVRPTLVVVYVWAAICALLAGLITSAASGTVDFRTVTNGTLLFEVVLVVVLGGIPLRGGRGGIGNILVGIALVAVLKNGMTLMNVSTQVQDVLKGVVLLVAVVIDNRMNPRDTETDTVGDL